MPLRLMYCDSAGIRRCKVLPDSNSIQSTGLTHACMSHPFYGDVIAPNSGLSASGECQLTPDTSTIVQLPWYPSHAVALSDMLNRNGTPWSCCPRSALRKALKTLKDGYDLDLLVGFEIEFVLLREGSSHDPITAEACLHPVDYSVYSQSSAIDTMAPVLDDMTSALNAMDISVLQYHAESGHGQFEISLAPYPALRAADKLILAKEAIAAIASRHGLKVSFAPKPSTDQAGNGLHCHMSLWKNDRNIIADDTDSCQSSSDILISLSQIASHFMAGILKHSNSIVVFTSPSPNSYQRIQPESWSGAYAVWGYENREALLRVVCPGSAETVNIEYKAFDGSTNPYIGLAAIVSAGLIGMSSVYSLPVPVSSDVDLSQHKRLPTSLKDALEDYYIDSSFSMAMKQILGTDLVRAFLAVRHMEDTFDPDGLHSMEKWGLYY